MLAEAAVGGPRGEPGVEEITAEEFERILAAARRVLEQAADSQA